MKDTRVRSWAIMALSLSAIVVSPGSLAKGSTVEVSISGPGIIAPIHTNDPALIAPNVWIGDFAQLEAESVSEPAKDLPRYLVHFWVDVRGGTQMVYTVMFVLDASTGRSYIQLPGRQSRWYASNVATILRNGQDGLWFSAAPQWAKAAARAIDR